MAHEIILKDQKITFIDTPIRFPQISYFGLNNNFTVDIDTDSYQNINHGNWLRWKHHIFIVKSLGTDVKSNEVD